MNLLDLVVTVVHDDIDASLLKGVKDSNKHSIAISIILRNLMVKKMHSLETDPFPTKKNYDSVANLTGNCFIL